MTRRPTVEMWLPAKFLAVTHPNTTKYPPVLPGERLTWEDALRRMWARPGSWRTTGRLIELLAGGGNPTGLHPVVVDYDTGEVISGHRHAAALIALHRPIPVTKREARP